MNENSFQDRENVTPCQAITLAKHWSRIGQALATHYPSIDQIFGQVIIINQNLVKPSIKYLAKNIRVGKFWLESRDPC